MPYGINYVTVIGAGTMGAAIAGHLANAGVSSTLLDMVPNELTAEEAAAGLSLEHPKVRNRVVQAAMERVVDSVRAGEGLARPLMQAQVFPPLAGHLMRVGEETGHLEHMLMRLAEIYDREVAVSLRRLVALAEPALIIGLGILIAGVVLSIVVAIFSINELAF